MPLSLTRDFKADPTGRQDAASSLRDALQQHMETGEPLAIERGTYQLAGKGDDTDLINLPILGRVNVFQHPYARFFVNSDRRPADGDVLRLVDHPRRRAPRPVSIIWRNWNLDQRAQCNSNVIPFDDTHYKPKNVGDSQTCDGLSIRCQGNVKTIKISGGHAVAGDHWRAGGADSALFIEGCDDVTVERFTARGFPDLALYFSKAKVLSRNNTLINCFGGVNIKRHGLLRSYHDTFRNCVRATACDVTSANDAGDFDVIVRNAVMIQCGLQGRYTRAKRAWAEKNLIIKPGATLDDGQPEQHAGSGLFEFRDCEYTRDRNNEVLA